MIDSGTIDAYALIAVCLLMIILLLRILFYIRKQTREVDAIKRQLELMNKMEDKR